MKKMILKDSLYRIKNVDTTTMTCVIGLIADSVIYKAHFPGHPVTPGVCIVAVASELLADMLACDVELVSVSNAKFLAVIDPCSCGDVTYSFRKVSEDPDSGTVKVSVDVRGSGVLYSRLSLVYRKS